jgi:cob(I)alamin adenosyltransferase
MAFKIYTKTGDKGETGLVGGSRVPKYHQRIEAYGTIDELNAVLGLLVSHVEDEELATLLQRIQSYLFTVGSHLAADEKNKMSLPALSEEETKVLERWIDDADGVLPPLKNFILPGGEKSASYSHLARTVCRRAERRIVELAAHHPVEEMIVVYINRLSDFLFVVARKLNYDSGTEDVKWESGV